MTPANIIKTFEGFENCIYSLECSPNDPHVFASSAEEESVRLWDIRTPTTSLCLHDEVLSCHPVGSVRYYNDNNLLVAAGLHFIEFDVRTAKSIRTINLKRFLEGMGDNSLENEEDVINDFDISSCGEYISAPLDSGKVVICNLKNDSNDESFTAMNSCHENISGHAIFGRSNVLFTAG